jgi:hypothetical protein
LFWAAEGVDGRVKPGQDENAGADFLPFAAARFSPDSPVACAGATKKGPCRTLISAARY